MYQANINLSIGAGRSNNRLLCCCFAQLFCLAVQSIGPWLVAGDYPGHSEIRSVLFFLTASMQMPQENVITNLQLLSLNIAFGGVRF